MPLPLVLPLVAHPGPGGLSPELPERLDVLFAGGTQLAITDLVQIFDCIGKGPVTVDRGALHEGDHARFHQGVFR